MSVSEYARTCIFGRRIRKPARDFINVYEDCGELLRRAHAGLWPTQQKTALENILSEIEAKITSLTQQMERR